MSETPEQADILLEIPDDLPKTEEIKVELSDEKPGTKPKKSSTDDALEELKANLEAEKAARLDAEKRAYEASTRASVATNEVRENQYHLISNALESVKQNSEVLISNYRDAISEGDHDRAARIQHDMIINNDRLKDLERGKTDLENQPRAQAPAAYTPSDPVEALASQLTPRSAEWIRRNPQYATNPKLYQKMIAAHQLVVSDDYTPDTDDYFDRVESILGVSASSDYSNPSQTAAKATQKRSSPPAAPVSRSGTGTGSRPNVVRLSAAEREIAQFSGMTDEEYARMKLKVQRESH